MQTHPLISKPKAGERRPAFWWRSFPMKLFGNIILSFYLCLAAGASMCGSGFIVQQNGYILTNYHVIKNATRITVTVPGRQEISARVEIDRKSTRLNSSHTVISYAVFCLKKKRKARRSWSCVHAASSTAARSYKSCADLCLS